MRLKKIGILCLVVWLAFHGTQIAMTRFFEKNYKEGRLEFYPKEESTYDELILKDTHPEASKVYIAQKTCKIKQKQKEQEVKVLAVSKDYSDFEPIRLMKGSLWGEQAQKEGRQVAIISKSLASRLFNTYEVIGESIEINETIYQIIGVYEKEKDMVHTLVDDGEERIYLPITSGLGQSMKVDSIWFQNEADTLQMNLGEGTYYKAEDAKRRLEGMTIISMNLLIVVAIMYLLKICIDTAFFKQALTHKERGIYIAGLFGVVFILFEVGIRHAYIPKEALPPYNIFDISYYWSYFKEQIHIHQKMIKLSVTSFETIYWLLTKWNLGLVILKLAISLPIIKWLLGLIRVCQISIIKKLENL